MDLEQIKELIDICAEKQIYELEVDEQGSKVRIRAVAPNPKVKYVTGGGGRGAAVNSGFDGDEFVLPDGEAAAHAPQAEVQEEDTSNYTTVKSPMVGTLYHSPSPDAPAYVKVGDMVEPDTVLCIVEAMKLMNEIKAEARGKIAQILVESGKPVEYGQPLFYLESV